MMTNWLYLAHKTEGSSMSSSMGSSMGFKYELKYGFRPGSGEHDLTR